MINVKYSILVPILIVLLVGCSSGSRNPNKTDLMNWKYGDLRLLDAIDSTNPDQDLIGVYTRINNQTFQIRLDFLDLDTYLGKDIYILLDTNSGGNSEIKSNNGTLSGDINWDYLLIITDSRIVEVVDNQLAPVPGMELFIVYDSLQDRLIISFSKSTLPIYYGKTLLQVIIVPPDQALISDKSVTWAIDSPPPPRGKILFTFWNTFTSVTPAQTLRSWAGAHSGPMSSRHGLKYLFNAAANSGSTLLLLDLLTPDTLSALDYLNVLPRVRILSNKGILVLPDARIPDFFGASDAAARTAWLEYVNLPEDANKIWQITSNLETNRDLENNTFVLFKNSFDFFINYNYKVGNNDYAKYNNIIDECDLSPQFLGSSLINHSNHLSVACKQLFLLHALSDSTAPLILGGDFSKSVMGDPGYSAEVFSYIREHPWLQTYTLEDLISSPQFVKPGFVSSATNNQPSTDGVQSLVSPGSSAVAVIYDKVHEALLQAPRNRLSDLAWKIYVDLSQPTTPRLLSLRTNYVGQIGMVLSAANWADNPGSLQNCDNDLDYDGVNECILSNTNLFAIIEPDGGYIPFVFSSDGKGLHQIIGPTWEFIVGLSDSSTWNIDLGVRSDAGQFLGAFQDPFTSWNRYNVELSENKVILENNAKTISRTISLYPDYIHIDIRNNDQLTDKAIIPLVVDPWRRYAPGWGDLYAKTIDRYNLYWGIYPGEMVEIRSTNPLTASTFNDTHSVLLQPEDPNFDYSPGHYLPFPMAIAYLDASENYAIDIKINP